MTLTLVVRRTIGAPRAALFDAWVTPAQLLQWWGPSGVRCSHAEVEPRVGGKLRIGNELPDGRTIWILGEFVEFVPPERLVYTWRTDPPSTHPPVEERVTVRFESLGDAQTEVLVLHERIADEASRSGHEVGWRGCLTHLDEFCGALPAGEAYRRDSS